LYIAKVQKEIKKGGGGKKKLKTNGVIGDDAEIIWYNHEDLEMESKALMCFFTEDKAEVQTKGESNIVTGRCIMIVKYSEYEKLVNEMK